MTEGGYLSQLLYLLVYSSSILSAAGVIVFRKKLNCESDAPLNRIILSIALSSTLLSVQVFLNAVGIPERLNAGGSARTVIILNILITAVAALLVISVTAASFSLRPASFSRKFLNITLILTASLLINISALQILLLSSNPASAGELLGILMLLAGAMLTGSITFSTVRLFIPLRLKKDYPVLPAARFYFICILIFPVFFLVSGSYIGTLIAPAGFIILNTLGIRLIYTRLTGSSPSGAVKSGPDPAEACRELGLSRRETEVALLLSKGRSYKDIAAELFISMSTTQTHVGRIYSKLGINSKTELSNLLYYTE